MQGGKDNERKHGRAKRENVIIWYRFPDSRRWDTGGCVSVLARRP